MILHYACKGLVTVDFRYSILRYVNRRMLMANFYTLSTTDAFILINPYLSYICHKHIKNLQFFFVFSARSCNNYFIWSNYQCSFCGCSSVEHFFNHCLECIYNSSACDVFSRSFNLIPLKSFCIIRRNCYISVCFYIFQSYNFFTFYNF